MKQALLVLDYMNDLVNDKGKLASKGYLQFVKNHATLGNVKAAIQRARDKGITLIYVKTGFQKNYKGCPENSPLFALAKQVGALQLETWGTHFHETIAPAKEDLVLTKSRVSAFHKTGLGDLLKKLRIEQLLVAGISTDLAVHATVLDAHDLDYNVVVLENCCAAASEEDHRNALNLMKKVATVSG